MNLKTINLQNNSLNSDFTHFRASELDSLESYCKQLKAEVLTNGPSRPLANFPRFVRTMDITRFLVLYETFKKITSVHGDICEIGVLHGFGTFALGHLSEIFEHRNYVRRIWGFDTFSGPPQDVDANDGAIAKEKITYSDVSSLEDMNNSAEIFNSSRAFNQFQKLSFIKGDVRQTVPEFVKSKPGLVVSLLICHLDLYGATKIAIECIYPRMPKGSIILFGSLNFDELPGETAAANDVLGIGAIRLERFPFATKWSYCIK